MTPTFWFTIHSSNSSNWYWLSPHDLLGFCSCSHWFFFFSFLNPPHPPPMAYMTWWRWVSWLVGWLVCCGIILHGLPTQQISRQQGVNRGGAPNHACILSTGRTPQAGVLRHTAPQQVASAGLASAGAAAPLANWVGLRCPAHSVLIGSRVGLPARGVCPQRLALCKKAVHFLLASKLRQDCGISEHAP